ncbi:hypothetical protein [Tenuibacillus multivorans]|uniref:Uncharacterized protein n=1 Tax=Tenuibacillus multivorans TaxID=237069 RepID=A0A1G9WY24_9BACI|nr:hypothetical protein [Tenuibacillus multivorans]GEL77305.1 hypothetical protein TMU01_15400 [Tenuibacillus multivorans]SDM89400.1 hypothetical protein SAMN05216498_0936 [Tenuibacillus multivorans]
MGELFMSLIFWAIGLLILYFVIAAAVKRGINQSILAQFLKQEYGIKEEEPPSFLDDDSNDWNQ